MLSLEEAACVTGPGGICCHGDLVRGCHGDGDERRQSGERHFWVVAWPTAYSTMPCGQRWLCAGAPQCCVCLFKYMCVCLNSCVFVSKNGAYLQCDSMISDHEMSDSLAPRWWSLWCLCSSPEELLTPQPPAYLITTTPHSLTVRSEVCMCVSLSMTVGTHLDLIM